MKILYVTGLWRGLRTILYEGQTEEMGMPAFMKPLKKLLGDGHEVDIFLIHKFDKYPEYNIKVSWISEKNIIDTYKWDLSLKGRFVNDYNVYKKTKELLKQKKYDIVYGHGDTSPAAAWAARKTGVPYGQRIYGSFLESHIRKYGKLVGSNRLIHDKWMFKNKQDFVLITNDGTKGDRTYEILNFGKKKPSDMYFWVNGVDPVTDYDPNDNYGIDTSSFDLNEPFIFYFARFQPEKGQLNAIEVLNILKEKGIKIKLVFGGQFSRSNYADLVKQKASEYGLEEQTVFLGQINKEQINALSKKAMVSAFFYYASNMGNCFHEVFSAGGLVLSYNDGSLDDYIVDGETGFLVNNNEEAAEIVEKIYTKKIDAEKIRQNAITCSRQKMKSWDERVNEEIALLEKYAHGNH